MSKSANSTNPAFDEAPERFGAHGKVRGIAIGLNLVCRIVRAVPQIERDAMIWLTNYAHLLEITADTLSVELDLSREEIRLSLTDPEFQRSRFVRQVAERS